MTFNGAQALLASVWSDVSITVSVSPSATWSNVVVTVSGQASAGVAFTVTNAPAI